MYKSVPADIKKIRLTTDLYQLHKTGTDESSFGMDNTATLLENGFGLYSSRNIKKQIGPIRTEYYRVALALRGCAQVDVGLEHHAFCRNHIMFGIPGQIFSLHDASPDFLTYYMLFTEDFLHGNLLNRNRVQSFPFLTPTGLLSFELEEASALQIEQLILKMNEEVQLRNPGCADVIRLYIQLIFFQANRQYKDKVFSRYGTYNTQQLAHRFLKLVAQHFLSVRKVSDYAGMLSISSDHLNRAVKTCSGKTAHEWIEEMILIETKADLLHSNLSVSEIGYKFDFADPSHFSHFFKKHCGITPLQFRRQSQLFQ